MSYSDIYSLQNNFGSIFLSKSRKVITLLDKNKIKKKNPMMKLNHAKQSQHLLASFVFYDANSFKLYMTKRLGKKYERPTPENVAMKPKSVPIDGASRPRTIA